MAESPVIDLNTDAFVEQINQAANIEALTGVLGRRIDKITSLNTRTGYLIQEITTKILKIQEAITSGRIPTDQLPALKTALESYIRDVEQGADTQNVLARINDDLKPILDNIQGQGGGRRTKKHKKSKSKGKGKGKAAKSNRRKTRRGRFGKAKKTRSRKHTSKRR